jgi:hypothetical protein
MLFALLLTAALDAGTTCHAWSRPGFYEASPIYGSHPSCGRVVATKAAGTGGAVWLGTKLKPKPRKWVMVGLIGMNATIVAWNVKQLRR